MQTRLSFNSGEFSPDLACRSDLDQFSRACSTLENWDIAQTGGVRRRRGMREFSPALSADSRLFPYIYSYADGDGFRFLVEVSSSRLRVFNFRGEVVFDVTSTNTQFFKFDLGSLHYRQVNKLLLLTCSSQTPMVLSYDGEQWSFDAWAFKQLPWRYNTVREHSITIVDGPTIGLNKFYNISFPYELPPIELPEAFSQQDYLRASIYSDQAESGWDASQILNSAGAGSVRVVTSLPSEASPGAMFAVLGSVRYKSYLCVQDFPAAAYKEGFDFPENYPNHFLLVADSSTYADAPAVRSLAGHTFAAGSKLRFVVQYWHYWTCVKDFSSSGGGSFADFPDYFMRGIPASAALPCRSAWAFYCSGLWYGEYAVRRNFDSSSYFDAHWNSVGYSRSLYGAAANVQVSGNESDEECYLRLFLTSSYALSSTSALPGFIPDACQNRLIVSAYLHDEVFKCVYSRNDFRAISLNKVHFSFAKARVVAHWSWAAFGERYGYPVLCDIFQSRLVFASTLAQPQTIWMSRTDDLDNFMLGNVDDAALALTLNTTSQNPICWLMAQGNRFMLGTGEREYVIGGGNSSVLTYKNVTATDHSCVGSSPIAALPVIDKVLYVERGAGRVYEFTYSLEVDGYVSRDLSVFASHILSGHGGALHSTLLRKPDTVAVFSLSDGQMALCTYNAHQEVKAWHRWITDGSVLDVCALPDGHNADKLFLLVQRGSNVFIEVVDSLSPFVDNGGRPYSSVLISNSLSGYSESAVSKRTAPPFAAFFGADVDLDKLQVCVTGNGGGDVHDWRLLNDNFASLSRGWHNNLISAAECGLDRRIGFCVTGDAPFELLALQG